jgi:tetratricopeptide (TPR) repeat protein
MELAAYLLVNDLRRLPVGEEISEEDRIPANNLVHEAMAACETLSQADQRLALPLFYRSQIHRNRSRLQEPQAAIASAIQDMELVIQRYPSNNQFWVEVADLYNLNNDSAKASAAAGRALQIDDINHNWGHRDRYLSTEQRNRMNQLAVSDSD